MIVADAHARMLVILTSDLGLQKTREVFLAEKVLDVRRTRRQVLHELMTASSAAKDENMLLREELVKVKSVAEVLLLYCCRNHIILNMCARIDCRLERSADLKLEGTVRINATTSQGALRTHAR
jgi:hypothetical protein